MLEVVIQMEQYRSLSSYFPSTLPTRELSARSFLLILVAIVPLLVLLLLPLLLLFFLFWLVYVMGESNGE